MLDWFWKRVFSERNIGYIIKNAQPHIQAELDVFVKNSIITTINDPEVGQWVTALGDGLYDRYMKKFTGFIGGTQKGINAQANRVADELNPFADIIGEDSEGNLTFNLMGAVKTFLSGGLSGLGSSSTGQPALPQGIPPPMGSSG